MNPRKLIPILFFLMCSAVTGAGIYIANVLSNEPAISEPQRLIAFTQVPTLPQEASLLDAYLPATPTPTPLDYGSLPITQTVVSSLSTASSAESTVAASKSTQVAIERNNGDATITAQVIGTGTAVAVATNNEFVRREQQRVSADEAEQKRLLDERIAQDNLSIAFAWVWKIGGSIILILATCLWMIRFFYQERLRANRKAVETISDHLLENIQAPVVQVSTDAHSGYEHHLAISSAEYAVLRKAVIELGGRLSRRPVVRGGYFTETRWNQIDDILLEKGVDGIAFFERNAKGGISPTKAGWKWLELTPPTSPQGEKSPESLETAVNHHATPPHTSGETQDKENL